MLLTIILATTYVSLISLVGVFFISLHQEALKKMTTYLVALSAGALMGGTFLHLMPEALESLSAETMFPLVLASFVLFFLIEKMLRWHHCHDGVCEVHTFGYMNIIGDAVHNFLDGLIIAGAFITNPQLGVATIIAIAAHEIPQEIGDFGVLLHSGMSRGKALLMNLFVGLVAVLGGIAGYFLSTSIDQAASYMLPLAAGGFLYIASADLLPEIRKENNNVRSFISFAIFLAGILLMLLVE